MSVKSKKILILFVILTAAIVVINNRRNKQQNAKPNNFVTHYTPAPTAKKTPVKPTFVVPKDINEAVSQINSGKIDGIGFRIFGHKITNAEINAIEQSFPPLPAGTELKPDEAKLREDYIRFLSYLQPDIALPYLTPFTEKGNLQSERLSALVAIGEVGGDNSIEFLKNFKNVKSDYTNEKDFYDTAVAVIMGIEKNGSKEAIPFYINMLKNVNAKDDRMIASYILMSLQRMTGQNLSPQFNPQEGNFDEVATLWSNWWESTDSTYTTIREDERGRINDLVNQYLNR